MTRRACAVRVVSAARCTRVAWAAAQGALWLATAVPLAVQAQAQVQVQPTAPRQAAGAGAGADASAGVGTGAGTDDTAVHLHTVVRGDTLTGLGRRLLVEPRRWPDVARANRLRNPDRLAVGSTLRIPLALMQTEPVAARVVGVVGAARMGEARAGAATASATQAGDNLPEGGALATGPDGHVTLRLVDGTLLRLRPDSQLQLRESRRVRNVDAVRSGARLERGRVEVEAAPAGAGRPGFTIDTPQGVLGVRGTEFRVSADPVQAVTRGEVLGGVVAFDGGQPAASTAAGAAAQPVSAGFGAVIGSTGRVSPPVRLLDAPDTTALPALQERLLMRFALPPQAGAVAYRGQIARDTAFDTVVADHTSATPELRFAELPDGDYVLRVRAIDGQGLEGRDADVPFRLKARPEAPLPSTPAPRAVLTGDRITFTWTANAAARSYRLQLAAVAGALPSGVVSARLFATPLRDLAGLQDITLTLDGLAPGSYAWRLASVRGDADQGPWGEPRLVELRPEPPVPKPDVVGDNSVVFAWEGRPGQSFDFDVARDLAFTQPVLQRRLDQPAIDLPLPGTGRFYVRLRARDADGFIGPYTTPQSFDVPNCLRDGHGGCVRAAEQTLNLAP